MVFAERPIAANGGARSIPESFQSEFHQHTNSINAYSDKKQPQNNPKLALLNSKHHNRNKSDTKLLKTTTEQVAKIYGTQPYDIQKQTLLFPIVNLNTDSASTLNV